MSASFDDQHLLAELLRQDRLAASMALSYLTTNFGLSMVDLGNPIAAAGIAADRADARTDIARAVLAVSPFSRHTVPTDEAAALRARDTLHGRTEFVPVERLCRLYCPQSSASSEIAVLVYPGLPFGGLEAVQPFAGIADPDTFVGSDRGLATLIPKRSDPAAAADRALAVRLDACNAATLGRRDAITLGD